MWMVVIVTGWPTARCGIGLLGKIVGSGVTLMSVGSTNWVAVGGRGLGDGARIGFSVVSVIAVGLATGEDGMHADAINTTRLIPITPIVLLVIVASLIHPCDE